MNTRCKHLAGAAAVVLSVMCVRESSAGLVTMQEDPQAGTIIAYSAESGGLAYDGPEGGHSPFAEALLRYLEAPLDVGLMLRWVRDAVLESTSGDQRPETHLSLSGRSVYLAENPALHPSKRRPAEGVEQENEPTRVALTIGNSAYEQFNSLKTPINDAAEIASSLERLGFLVARFENTDKATLDSALQEFREKASNAAIAVVFYSGHGVQFGGGHYLIPVDAQIDVRAELDAEAVPLGLVMDAARQASVLRLIVVDAMFDDYHGGR